MLLPSMLPLDVVMVHHHHIKREHWCPLHKAPLLPLSHHYTLDVVVGVAVVVLALVSPCCKPLGSKNPTHGAFYRSIGSCTNTWIYETYCLKDQYNLQGYSHQCVQMAPAAASRGTATNAYKWPLQQPGGIASFTNGYRRRIINNHPSTITLLQGYSHQCVQMAPAAAWWYCITYKWLQKTYYQQSPFNNHPSSTPAAQQTLAA
jgi:hypothetical protein